MEKIDCFNQFVFCYLPMNLGYTIDEIYEFPIDQMIALYHYLKGDDKI